MIYILIFISILIPIFWYLYKYIKQQKEIKGDLNCISRKFINKFELDLLANFEEYRIETSNLPYSKKFDFYFYIRNYKFYVSADYISYFDFDIFNIFLVIDNEKHFISSPFLNQTIKTRLNEYIDILNKKYYENLKIKLKNEM